MQHFQVAEFGEPDALLNNPNSQFAKMILAAASVNDKYEGVKARWKCSLPEAKESPEKSYNELNWNERRNSMSESDDFNPVVTISDSSDAGEYDNKAYQSNESDDETSDIAAM